MLQSKLLYSKLFVKISGVEGMGLFFGPGQREVVGADF